MRLDRNEKGRGKYAIINLRKLEAFRGTMVATGERPREAELVLDAVKILEARGLIEYGEPGTEHEFFVIKLKDKFAWAALHGYEVAVDMAGHETSDEDRRLALWNYSDQINELSNRAGRDNPWCKDPD